MGFPKNTATVRLSKTNSAVTLLLMAWLVSACSSDGTTAPASDTTTAGSEQTVTGTLTNGPSETDSITAESEQTTDPAATDTTTDTTPDADLSGADTTTVAPIDNSTDVVSEQTTEAVETDTTPDAEQSTADTTPDAEQSTADTTTDADQSTAYTTTPDADQSTAYTTTPDADQSTADTTTDASIDNSNDVDSEQTADSAATDTESADSEQTPADTTPSESAEGPNDDTGGDTVDYSGAIPGLWNVTRGDDVQYLEARANGHVTIWDYRGDSFQNGQDCYVKTIGYFRYGGGMSIDVFGEEIAANADINDRQVTFSNSEGNIDMPRVDDLVSTDFPVCGGDSNNFGAIPGLWDITVGDDVQYFEARANGDVSIWDYRADPFQNGQDCYVESSAFFLNGGTLTTEVFGEGIVVDVDTTGGQAGFTDIDGMVDFPRVFGFTSREFNSCGEG